MIELTSVSGGKSSAYIYANFKSHLNIFSLVRLENKEFTWMKGKDEKTRQLISDRIGCEFVGTAEMDEIIYTILDLEQTFGKPIKVITGITFEELIRQRKGFLPSHSKRFCTTEFKIKPIFNYCYDNGLLPVNTKIGYRLGEEYRQDKILKKLDSNGFEWMYKRLDKKPNSRYHTRNLVKYRKVEFPLIKEGIGTQEVESYWKDYKVRFAAYNNCVGCVNRQPLFLNYLNKIAPYEMRKFIYLEQYANDILKAKGVKGKVTFRPEGTIESFANPKIDFGLFAQDFSSCDSGYCHD